MAKIQELFERIKRDHSFALPLPEAERIKFESHLDLPLPDDWREFFSLCNGASIHENNGECWYEFVPLDEVRRTRIDVLGEDIDYCNDETIFWVSVCNVQDGNYVSAALESVRGSFCWMLDNFHEEFGLGKIIATSFTDFLEGALNADKSLFWLQETLDYGTATEHLERTVELNSPERQVAALPFQNS